MPISRDCWSLDVNPSRVSRDERETGPQVLLGKQLLWNWSAPIVPSNSLAYSRPPFLALRPAVTAASASPWVNRSWIPTTSFPVGTLLNLSHPLAEEDGLPDHRTLSACPLESDASPHNRTVRLLRLRSPHLLSSHSLGSGCPPTL